MSDINMILCVLMIVASVLNVAAFVHRLHRPSELREAIERATSEDPKYNFWYTSSINARMHMYSKANC